MLPSQYPWEAVHRATFPFNVFRLVLTLHHFINDELAGEAEHTFLCLCTYPGFSRSLFRWSFVSCCWKVTCAVAKQNNNSSVNVSLMANQTAA